MAEKVLRLHPSRGFFLDAGLHLVNPEKPQVILHESYEAPEKVLKAIERGTLIDINGNIAVKEEVKVEAPAEPKEEPKQEETPKEDVSEEEKVEAKEEKKAPAKKKSTKK